MFLPGKWKSLRDSVELKETIETLLEKPTSQRDGLRLIAAAESIGMTGRVIEFTKSTDLGVSVGAMEALGRLPTIEAVKALEGLVKERDHAVRSLGLILQRTPNSEIGVAALKCLMDLVTERAEDRPAHFRREAAIEALVGTRAGAARLLKMKEEGKMPDALGATVGMVTVHRV